VAALGKGLSADGFGLFEVAEYPLHDRQTPDASDHMVRIWPVAVCAAQQIMYSSLSNPTGSNGIHCSLSNLECLY